MAMARDGLLPRFFAKVHKKTHVPVNGTVISGCIATLMAFTMNVDQLAGMVIFLAQSPLLLLKIVKEIYVISLGKHDK
jgi:amino acid transporter